MHHENIVSSDLLEISNLFARHFQSVYINSSNNLQCTDKFKNSLNLINLGNLSFSNTDIEKVLSEIKEDNRLDMDEIAPVVLKKCSKEFAIPLNLIFNFSLRNGEFLLRWKSSFITPIFKSGNRQEVVNYRPICKISIIPKNFEKLVYLTLTPLLKNTISPYQHGFVTGRTTCTNLTKFTNYVINGFKKECQSDVVYTDFSKAFDRVDHHILLMKLKVIGFHSSLLKWIHSYLTNRTQYVKINDTLSSPIYVTSGVPQGSHLGPLFFLLFVNDIPNVLSNSECLMYADDLKLFRHIKTENDCKLLQEDLNKLSNWCLNNSLHLNIDKCQSLTYYRNRSRINFCYKINDLSLCEVNFKKDLGVIFDHKLTFTKHIDFLVAKGNTMLGFVLRNSKELNDPHTLKSLYFAFVRSNVEYCSNIWNPNYEVHSSRIEKIQKRFTRVLVSKLHWRIDMPSYVTRCKLFGLLSLKSRRKFSEIMFIRDILSGHIDCSDILALINFNVPARMLRNRIFFKIPNHKTNYAANEPLSRCLNSANSLNDLIDFNLSRFLFKQKLLIMLNT